jgi:hypothetical protein
MSIVRTVQPPLNKAMYFDGVDDYVGGPVLSMVTKSVTSCGWVNVSPRSANLSFLWRTYVGSYGGFGVLIYNGGFQGCIRTTSDTYSLTQPPYPFSEQWYFVCHRFNRDTRVHELIINGQVVASYTHPRDEDLYVSNFEVGRGGTYPDWRYVKGLIGEVLVYSRVLSLAEIVHNMLNPDNPVRNGLVLWFQAHPDYIKDIDNDNVLEWIDLSGFGNHGKIYGARLVQLIKSASRVIQAQRVLACAR